MRLKPGMILRVFSYRGDNVSRVAKVIKLSKKGTVVVRRFKRGEVGAAIRSYIPEHTTAVVIVPRRMRATIPLHNFSAE
jgi:hypothetical protein